MQKYFNINETETNNPIYRIFNIDRLFQLIDSGKNGLVRPSSWDDPYENLLKNITIIEKKGHDTAHINFREYTIGIYGQCWTLNNNSDLLWRVYSPEKNGVMIRSSIFKLFETIKNSKSFIEKKNDYLKEVSMDEDHGYIRELDLIIGKVKYLNKEDVITELSKSEISLNSLFIKRTEFKDEQEIRILVKDFSHYDYNMMSFLNDEVFEYEIDFNYFIEEVIFDGRLSKRRYEAYSYLLKELGYKNEIRKLDTYYSPDKIYINKYQPEKP